MKGQLAQVRILNASLICYWNGSFMESDGSKVYMGDSVVVEAHQIHQLFSSKHLFIKTIDTLICWNNDIIFKKHSTARAIVHPRETWFCLFDNDQAQLFSYQNSLQLLYSEVGNIKDCCFLGNDLLVLTSEYVKLIRDSSVENCIKYENASSIYSVDQDSVILINEIGMISHCTLFKLTNKLEPLKKFMIPIVDIDKFVAVNSAFYFANSSVLKLFKYDGQVQTLDVEGKNVLGIASDGKIIKVVAGRKTKQTLFGFNSMISAVVALSNISFSINASNDKIIAKVTEPLFNDEIETFAESLDPGSLQINRDIAQHLESQNETYKHFMISKNVENTIDDDIANVETVKAKDIAPNDTFDIGTDIATCIETRIKKLSQLTLELNQGKNG